MVSINARTVANRFVAKAGIVTICSSFFMTLSLAAPQNPKMTAVGQRKVALIIHEADQSGQPVPLDSAKEIEATEAGKKLPVVDSLISRGRKQIALLLDCNLHQRKVLTLEQQTAIEMLSAFERERSRVLVTSFGAEIHSTGELTDDIASLKTFAGALRVETDKRNETVLLYDAMKMAYERLYEAPGDRAIVVFTEGNDHGSSVDWRTLARLAQRAHIACYVVMFADHSFYGREVRHYGYYLVELAPQTGGRLYEVGDSPRKAQQTARQVLEFLDSQRLIEVLVPDVAAPDSRINRFHAVRVISDGHPIAAQSGYYDDAAQPAGPNAGPAKEVAPAATDEDAAPKSEATASPDPSPDEPQSVFPRLKDTRFWLSGQTNFIFQTHPPFHAAYSGKNSLNPNYEKASSRVLTLYTGMRLNNSTELLVDVEESGGAALSKGLGAAGFPNLDIVRNPFLSKAPYLGRAMVHKVFALSEEKSEAQRNVLTLFDELPRRRLEIRFGKFSLVDFFDQNSVATDTHFQFTNWAIGNNGAYDYAADTRGYTIAFTADYEDSNWGFRFSEALMPKVANGIDLVWRPWEVHAENFEYELRKGVIAKKSGVLRLLAFTNYANMGIYRDAIAQFKDGLVPAPDITAHPWHITRKYGFGVNLEQKLTSDLTAFGRFGWNNGKTESFVYTEIDQTFSTGLRADGALWHRMHDRAGVAFVSNGISGDHRTYLSDGGYGFLIGDGALRYGREKIVEGYYTCHVWRGIYIAPGLQHIVNPAYNRDRGPVLVPSLRLHLEL